VRKILKWRHSTKMNLFDVCVPFVFMKVLFFYHHYEYTKLSFVLFLYALYRNKSCLIPMICINSTSVCVSFHYSLVLDPEIFDKFCEKWDLDIGYFWTMNIVTHVLPIFPLLYIVGMNRLKTYWYYGLYTSSFHLFWCYMVNESFDLSNLYVYMETYQWYILWSVTVITHMTTSLLLSKKFKI